ncbi:hypothetical protein C8J55DRAFT_603179 [Lentinula edodes]|uniref:Uncharacterized protein n=1 Tax=Lentinula lateritia TaxID=40482 RepID=A0A9W9AYB9_9AGAR|nr:hypothetical protein C8J55DRAFT_603179 [Lentinula edodes]
MKKTRNMYTTFPNQTTTAITTTNTTTTTTTMTTTTTTTTTPTSISLSGSSKAIQLPAKVKVKIRSRSDSGQRPSTPLPIEEHRFRFGAVYALADTDTSSAAGAGAGADTGKGTTLPRPSTETKRDEARLQIPTSSEIAYISKVSNSDNAARYVPLYPADDGSMIVITPPLRLSSSLSSAYSEASTVTLNGSLQCQTAMTDNVGVGNGKGREKEGMDDEFISQPRSFIVMVEQKTSIRTTSRPPRPPTTTPTTTTVTAKRYNLRQ